MLETVRGAVRKLSKISNCALNAIIIIIIIVFTPRAAAGEGRSDPSSV